MSSLEPGAVIGDRYEILSLIKAGGMGAVYHARDVRGGPLVALKEMLHSFPYEVDRNLIYKKFEEEARLLELLNHPSIPRVLAHFARGDNYYIVMEYIEGESLEQLLDDYLTLTRKPMPPPLVVECAMLLCPILQYLHSQPRPIIHRDIK
ncbi:MAG TPA: protein kinase, partial [Candidatus Xenobia bacterium]